MAQIPLVSEKVRIGKWIVRAADAMHVPLRAAFWVFEDDSDRWRLILEADPAAKLGMREFIELLHGAVDAIKSPLRRDDARHLLLFETGVYTQPHPLSEHLRPKLGKAASVSRTRMSDAVLYRLEPAQQF